MDRHIVISTDGHAFSPGNGSTETKQLKELDQYLEARFLPDYEQYCEAELQRLAQVLTNDDEGLFSTDSLESFDESEAVRAGGLDGLFDSDRRTQELENQGICAEVLFPNGPVPFGGSETYPLEMRIAGAHAYNRWLVDFCAQEPGRRAGLAFIDVHDLDRAAAEVAWARENGLRGVNISAAWWDEGLAPYYDPRYDAFWSACQEYEMPVHFHGGVSSGDYGDYGAMSLAVFATEATLFYGSRAFPYLVWGGVLERYPDLRVVFTESRGAWLLMLQFMDRLVDERAGNDLFAHLRKHLPLKASDYFRRQVFLGCSMMSREEALQRHELGLGNLMWGADYPHYEGTWPRTTAWLQSAFGGLPSDEVHTILAENPGKVYGFDLEALRPIADRIGPTTEELAAEPDESLWEW